MATRKGQQRRRFQEGVHDAAQPLTYAVATMELMRRRDALGELDASERARLAQRAIDAVAAAAAQLRALLTEDTPGGPAMLPSRRERHEMSELLALAMKHLPDDQVARLQILRNCPQAVGVWNADEVVHILGNLIDNAFKFSASTQSVEITLSCEDRSLIVEVRDHGLGLTQKELRSVWHRFYRSPRVRDGVAAGTGLGLASCSVLAKRNGGKIEAMSEGAGKGAVLRLVLPKLAVCLGLDKRTSDSCQRRGLA